VLADEMGLGKTAQALAACAWLARTAGLARVLVVCPASVKHQWVAEARRFLDQPTVAVIEGPRARREEAWRGDAFLTVVNYELLRQDVDLATGAPARFGLVVLDEAQRIKDWRARTSEAVKRLGRAVPRAFVLTGTPLSNDLDELYSVMQFVDPRVLGPLWSFNERYFAFDASGRVLGYRHLDEVRRKIAPVLLRRTREEVQLELPEVVESTRLIEMTREQRALHAERAAVVARLVETLRGRPLLPPERERLLGALATMRMACDSLFVLDRRTKTAPKLDELVAILREVAIAGGRKVLVFSEWERMTALAAARLDAERIGYVRLHGGVPSGQRGALVERFTQDPACRVFLSTDAGGVGLNLQAASVVVHLDLPWSPARLDQRLGRALRIGQRATVQVVRLVAQGTIEERLLDTLARKRALLDAVIAGDGPDEIAFREPREAEAALLEGLVSGGGVPEPSPPEEPAAAAPVAPEPSAPKPPAAREDLRDRAREKAEVAAFLLTGGFLREAVLRAAEAAAEDVRAALSGTEAPPDGPALLAQAWAAARAGALDGAALERWRLLRDLAAIVGAGEPLDPGLAREAVEALAEGARADARARPDFAAPPDAR
jgi:SNF2 family DNA or RNA helicase